MCIYIDLDTHNPINIIIYLFIRQQDSQEFLLYLLEGLHEDVNRVTKKVKVFTNDDSDEEIVRWANGIMAFLRASQFHTFLTLVTLSD